MRIEPRLWPAETQLLSAEIASCDFGQWISGAPPSGRAASARSGVRGAAGGTSARAAGHARGSRRDASARGAMQQEIRE
jgi:hypothetical protein